MRPPSRIYAQVRHVAAGGSITVDLVDVKREATLIATPDVARLSLEYLRTREGIYIEVFHGRIGRIERGA